MIHKIARRTIIAALLALPTLLPAFQGKVVGVADGDTITVLQAEGNVKKPIKVRLWGIDCPEKKQPFGQTAKALTSSLAFGQVVSVDVRNVDRYGRSVGWVSLPDGRILNLELVHHGLAWWYKQYARKALDIQAAETKARAARVGLWTESGPIPPWLWRRSKK